MRRFDPDRPFNDLPPPPDPADLETRRVLKACIGARARLAELRELISGLPNPAILGNSIPILEAGASSSIENIVTTTDELLRHAAVNPARADPATREALRYRAALRKGFETLKVHPISVRTAVEVCTVLMNHAAEVRRVPGTRLSGKGGEVTVYTPPVGEERLYEKLSDWERYLHLEGNWDPLVLMAAGHYQFEAIHPFTDGNGRTGRILNLLYLCQRGLLGEPILYLSGFINQTRGEYYDRLLAVTKEEDWEAWLIYLIKGVESAADWTLAKARAILRLMQSTATHVQAKIPAIYSRELVEQLFEHPYCRIANLVNSGMVKRQTASVYLKQLADINVLREQQFGREKIFLHRKLVRLLTSGENEFEPYE